MVVNIFSTFQTTGKIKIDNDKRVEALGEEGPLKEGSVVLSPSTERYEKAVGFSVRLKLPVLT